MNKDKTTKKEIDGFEERFDKKFPNVLTELGYDYPKGTDNFKKIKQFISQLLEEKDRECIEAIKSVTKTNDSYYKIKMDDLIEKVESIEEWDSPYCKEDEHLLLAIKDEYIRVMTQEYSSNTISLIIENAIIKAYNKSHNDTDSLLSFFKIPIK